MPGKIILSLVSESLSGDVGSEWEYRLRAELKGSMISGSKVIEVPYHVLRPGNTQEPPNAGRAVMLEAGECGGEVDVHLTIEATDVEWILDDWGSSALVVPMICPGPGKKPAATEVEILAKVKKAPGFQGGSAVLKVKVRLVARCE